MKQLLSLLTLTVALAACSDATVIKPAKYQDLSGWTEDSLVEPFAVFVESCHANETRMNAYQSRNEGPVGVRVNWTRACTAADALGQPTNAQAREFFETYFAPYKIETERQKKGLMTGYYEPILHGSKVKKAPYLTPVYGVPDNLTKPYLTREQIVNGEIGNHAKVLLWVDDPVGLFFLHVQGSGKVRMTDGSMVGLQYAAQNGYEYVPIGRIMKERGYITEVSLQTIRDWLNQQRESMDEVMNQNPSYVFFKIGPGDKPAKGALGIPLTALRSIAVDDDRAAYGVPTFIDTTKMDYRTRSAVPLKRLFVSQDTGGALHSPHRADIFYGQGDAAEWEAGHQNSRANVYWLLPLAEPPHLAPNAPASTLDEMMKLLDPAAAAPAPNGAAPATVDTPAEETMESPDEIPADAPAAP